MTYGLQVYNQNGNTLIDTDYESQMQVPGGINTHGTSSGITRNDGEIILWNAASGVSTVLHQSFGSTTINNNSTVNTYNYIRIKAVSEIAPVDLPSASTYGIQIFDAGGNNTVTFSDAFDKSFTILNIYSPGTKQGGTVLSADLYNLYSGNPGSTVFVGAGKPFYNFAAGGGSSWNNFVFSTSGITFQNYFTSPITGSLNVYNDTLIIVAELKN